ncbi:MAG: serine hydrolase [Kiritimatiellae bacterium]|nr:serine hydrolase [Kiritimatiellia bacterium]
MKNIQNLIQGQIDNAVESGRESAIQVAAYLDGKLIVNAWSSENKYPIDENTLFPFFSTGKGIAATAVLRLAEKGIVSLDVPISEYWPRFGCNGKENINLRQVLSHTAGMHLMPLEKTCVTDWHTMCNFLADAKPVYEPGTQRSYHAITYSWLLGETAQRADGRNFSNIIHDEVFEPLGINSIFFGLPNEKYAIALDAEKEVTASNIEPSPPDTETPSAIPYWVCPLEDWINRRDVRKTCMPSSNGFGNALGIAKHYASLLGTGVDGIRLLSNETVEMATFWDKAECERVGGASLGLYGFKGPEDNPGSVFGHGGYGGSLGIADKTNKLALAVVKNRMGGNIADEIYQNLKQL